jgi:hypothetical protein
MILPLLLAGSATTVDQNVSTATLIELLLANNHRRTGRKTRHCHVLLHSNSEFFHKSTI